MRGFFSIKETQSKLRPGGKSQTCVACGLYKSSEFPKLEASGGFEKSILCIGGVSSVEDAKKGKHWETREGKYLHTSLERWGIDLERDCATINSINCVVEKDKQAINQLNCCRTIVLKEIDKYQPKVIILFGMLAVQSVIGARWRRDLGNIEQWRGWLIPDQDFKCWVCPVYSPEEVLQGSPEMELIFRKDLAKIMGKLNEVWPRFPKYTIDIIDDLSVFNEITSGAVAIDFETTGLKPHAIGHRIVCAAVSDTPNHSYAFMMPKTKNARKPFLDLLGNCNVGKYAHNMKYEHIWAYFILKQEIRGWQFDSMLASHCLDNRDRVTSLKFQAYVIFGIVDYVTEVDAYLKSAGLSGNEINNVLNLVETKEGTHDLLTYCAMDTIIQHRLTLYQIEKLNYQWLPF